MHSGSHSVRKRSVVSCCPMSAYFNLWYVMAKVSKPAYCQCRSESTTTSVDRLLLAEECAQTQHRQSPGLSVPYGYLECLGFTTRPQPACRPPATTPRLSDSQGPHESLPTPFPASNVGICRPQSASQAVIPACYSTITQRAPVV